MTPLRGMPGVRFVNYQLDREIEAGGRVFVINGDNVECRIVK